MTPNQNTRRDLDRKDAGSDGAGSYLRSRLSTVETAATRVLRNAAAAGTDSRRKAAAMNCAAANISSSHSWRRWNCFKNRGGRNGGKITTLSLHGSLRHLGFDH